MFEHELKEHTAVKTTKIDAKWQMIILFSLLLIDQ